MALRRRAWLRLLAVALAGLATGLAIGAAAAPGRVRAAVEARGCTAGDVRWHGPVLRVSPLRCGGLTVGQADLRPLAWDVALAGIEVEPGPELVAVLAPPAEDAGSGGGIPGWLPGPRQVFVEDLDVRLGEALVVRDLRGTLLPPRLDGPDTRVVVQDSAVLIEHRLTLDGEPMAGTLALRFVWDVVEERTSGSVEGAGLTLSHPLLAGRPLAGLGVHVSFEGTLDPSLAHADLVGTVHLGGPAPTWHARLDERGVPALDVALPDAPAAAWLAPLGPLVPELEHATVEGTIGGAVAWTLDGGFQVHPRIGKLGVSGAVPAGLDLRYGPFMTSVPGADGERVPRRTGEGTPGWTPLADISPDLVHAVLAAEDAGFFQHAGYDPEAIQAALDADLSAGEVVRGGSTLTQQLAKNLFLDGQQTLVRKLRELLLAVELDRTLGKDRVLELYLNVVELGPGVYGVGQACELYLMKAPARVTPLEAAFLAALLPSPRPLHQRWYLEGRPDRARIDAILDNMVDGGWLGVRAAERWKAAPLVLVPPPRPEVSMPAIPLPSSSDIATLAAALDVAAESERVAWLAGLPRAELGALYELCEGRAMALCAMHAGEGEPVIHEGINSAPSFRRFQKRMVLHEGEVKGHNHQPWAWLVGDGTFVVRPSPEREGELWFDYTGLPDSAFPGFPPPRSNTAGLSRFVYGHMIDVVRQVSAHVCIGKAFKRGEFAGFFFALCRTGS